MVYRVKDILFDLDGHEKELDRIIKIKMANGTEKHIEGMSFRNIIANGNDIIYLHEEDPLWNENKEQLKVLLVYGLNMALNCDEIINSYDYDDTDFALESMIIIAREVDYWLDLLKIKHNYEPSTGPDGEIFDKFQLLREWYNRHIDNNKDKL